MIPLALDGTPAEDEQQLYEILKNLKSTGSLSDIDGDVLPVPDSDDTRSLAATEVISEDAVSPDETSQELPAVSFADLYSSPPLIVIAVSCIAALFAVLCIGAGLYACNHVNNLMIKSGLVWDVLPRLERRVALDMSHDGDDDGGDTPRPEKRRLLYDAPLPPVNVFDEKSSEELNEKLVDFAAEDEDVDEKFHDAQEQEPSLLFLDSDFAQPKPAVPRIVVEDHADPDLLPLPDMDFNSDHSTPFATPLRTPLASPTRSPARRAPQMREVQSSPTLSSKPSWSLRAADAPPLGLTSPAPSRSDSPTPMLPGALFADDAPEAQPAQVQRPRQRTPRQPLDIAFALQLRPGLGLGADSAWLVRFLMAMFGWMTFFIGGNAPPREDPRRALTA